MRKPTEAVTVEHVRADKQQRGRGKRKGLAAVGVLALITTLGACGGEPEPPKKTVELNRPSPSVTTSEATPSDATPSSQGTIPVDPVTDRVIRGLNPAATPEEEAVAERWFQYRELLGQMYRDVTLDRTRLGELATGQGFDRPAGYVLRMQQAGTHNEGGTIASITTVKVEGKRAVVRGCLRSSLLEMTEDKIPVERLEVYVVTRDVLELEGPDWRMVSHQVPSVRVPCTYR